MIKMSDSLKDKRMRSETQISEQLDERLTINVREDNKRIYMNVNAKNSFDRFGDDLTEEILQYLTFEDKIRLECVSKQWQRCVFQKQFVIEINNSKSKNNLKRLVRNIGAPEEIIKRQELRSVLTKCSNIKKVVIGLKAESAVLSLIGQYCPSIKSLSYAFNGDEDLDFFSMYGHKLDELILYHLYHQSKPILKLCPNVKKFWYRLISIPLPDILDNEFLPKLENFGQILINSLIVGIRDPKVMKILSDKYSQTMKTLNVRLGYLTVEELKTCIDCIARFENLRQLKVMFYHNSENKEPIDNYLSPIGQKCTKLLELNLNINDLIPISDRFLDEFKTIKKLRLHFRDETIFTASVECLKNCKQLKELDIRYSRLTEHFFTNINIFIPNLQCLRITTEKQFSESFIDSFLSMKNIQMIYLFVYRLPVKGFYRMNWFFGKYLSEVMLNPIKYDVIKVNDNMGFTNCYIGSKINIL